MNARLKATIVIWVAFSVMTIVIMTSTTSIVASSWGGAFAILLLLGIITLGATVAIWNSEGASEPSAQRLAKAKRSTNPSSRVARLVNDLDDDEVYELEALLLGQERPTDQQGRRS